MKKKDMSKPKLQPLLKKNKVLKPIKSRASNNNSKKNEQKIPKNKISKKKVRIRSMSAVAKDEPKIEQIKLSNSLNNSLELDYLNFTQIDLFKLNQSFEGDIFTPNFNSNNQNNRDKIILNRYEDSISTINDNSNIINTNNLDNENLEKIKNVNFLTDTPSTICNYYEQSSNKNKISNKKEALNNHIHNENVKKNLADYYDINNSNKNEIKSDQKEEKNFDKNSLNKNDKAENKLSKQISLLTKKGQEIPLKSDIPFTNNMMKNYLKNNTNNKKKINSNLSLNSNGSNLMRNLSKEKEKEKENNIKKDEKKSLKSNIYKNYSKSNDKINEKKNYNNCNKFNNTNNAFYEAKNLGNNKMLDKINVNIISQKSKIRRLSQQKPTNIYYNPNKFESYFITPRNFNKIKKEKNSSSTKSTKIATASMGKSKSFSSNKMKNPNNYNNKNDNHAINKYKIIKEIIEDKKVNNKNKKNKNKTTPKMKNSHTNIKPNAINFIKVNLKFKTKSSSNLASNKKQFSSKNHQIFNLENNLKNTSKSKNNNNKIKSEIKNSFNTFQNIYKTIKKDEIKSPDKDPNNNLFQTSKTLTEQNVIVHKIEATPKNYRIQKFDSVPFTTIVKKIFVGSSKKDNLIKFDSSLKKKEKTKTEQIKCIFKPKTQSDFKPYNNMIGNDFSKKNGNNPLNGEYGNDKHVKQKLLDRMNKATNNWQYIFKGKKSKKVQDEGTSGLKSQNKDNKEFYNYFYKNENIISDGSEKEEDDI